MGQYSFFLNVQRVLRYQHIEYASGTNCLQYTSIQFRIGPNILSCVHWHTQDTGCLSTEVFSSFPARPIKSHSTLNAPMNTHGHRGHQLSEYTSFQFISSKAYKES